ncbi:MAG: UbiD family decarboxylase [Dehalococcoidia bacterium]|nr:UbiD family decarboxylase [Dehalococcoidia bacterium]MDZ4246849.1 UbiD family decarboxylase [Dehalococcoidia bacterium]
MDLRLFIDKLEKLEELVLVKGADWNLEIGTLTELFDENQDKALLFDEIKGYPRGFRVLTNAIATPKRLAATFGFPDDISKIELVRRLKTFFLELKPIPPVHVKSGPVMENIFRDEEVDLLKFPTPLWHELDGGRYLGTGDMVIMRDPEGKWVNTGTYRVQLHDRDTLGLYISPGHQGRLIREAYWAQGKPCPVAIVFGAHPLVWMPSFLAFPWGTEEFTIAGALLGEPLQLITGEYTGLPIPAYAEIAIEGEVLPPEVEMREEGPFGEWPGYYGSGERKEPVVKVKRIMHRNDPIIMGSPPLKPPSSGNCSYIMRAGNIWYELEKLGIPGIKGVWNMRAGGSRFLNVIAIEQKYAGHAKQVGMAAMSGAEGAYHGRFVIVVDDDIDPTDDNDVLWAVATRCDPATSIEIIHQCWSTPLDPTIPPERKAKGDFTNSRAIILATRPFYWRKEFPKVNKASKELRETTLKKYASLFTKK